MPGRSIPTDIRDSLLKDVRGSALVEFAITLPLLVVFVVGIYDFSGAFNQKQKIAQAAQEGAIVAGRNRRPTSPWVLPAQPPIPTRCSRWPPRFLIPWPEVEYCPMQI